MNKDEELYQEETVQNLKDINKRLEGSAIIPIPKMPTKMKTEVINEITANVINKIEIDEKPFEELSKKLQNQLELVTAGIVKAVVDNAKEPAKEVTVKNITDAKNKEVVVTNLKELQTEIKNLAREIVNSQPIVNVEKQNVVFPQNANNPISVRLSDGKSFYNAVAALAQSGISQLANANLEKLAFDGVNLKVIDASGGGGGTTTGSSAATDIFNSAVSGSRYNQVEIDFSTTAPASITDITVTTANGGSSSNLTGQAKFTSGTNTSGGIKAVSNTTVVYRPHAEIYAAFTAIFTAGVANSYQRIGIYDANNGFFIGYEGTSFGITKRTGGVDTTTAQTSFNVDKLNANSSSLYTKDGIPQSLDTTKDNLYRIRYGWLGAAMIIFEVYSPDGTWVIFHKIKVANNQTVPSIQNPNLPLTLDIQKSTAGATELIMYSACWAAGTTSNFSKVTDTITDNTLAGLNRSVIVGKSSAGGGTYVNAKVTPSGSLTTAIGDITGVVGQNTMANSLPVAIASNQSAVPISASSLPLPTGAATSANQTTTNTSLNNIDTDLGAQADASATTDTGTFSLISLIKRLLTKFTTTANGLKVDGSAVTQPVSGTFWQTTQPVSGTVTSNIGTTNGLALDATLTGGTQTTKVTDGTNTVGVIKSDGTSAAGNAISAGYTGYTTSFSVTAVSATTAIDMTNYSSVSVHITSQGTSSVVTPQWSNDNTNWVGGSFTQINGSTSAATTSTSTAGMVLYTAKHGRYFRLNVTGITAGTTAGNIHVSTSPINYQTVGGSVGNIPTSGSATGNITSASSSIVSTSTSGLSQAYITISGTYSGISFGISVSADAGTTYASVPFTDLTNSRYYKAGATVSPTDNSTVVYMVPISPLTTTVRVLASAWVSGTGAIRINYGAANHTQTFQQPQVVTHTALPTAATTPNSTPSLGDKFGRQVVIPGTVRDLVGTQTTTISASTAETTVVTAAASTFNDLTAITVANTSTTPARVDFRNTTAGSVIFSLYVPGSDVRGITFQRPVPQASVNTNWTATSSASVTDLRVFAVYDKNA